MRRGFAGRDDADDAVLAGAAFLRVFVSGVAIFIFASWVKRKSDVKQKNAPKRHYDDRPPFLSANCSPIYMANFVSRAS